MKKNELKQQIAAAIQACLEKKAEELSILEMEKGSGAFTDYFVLCSGTNPRQVQAIADEVELRLKAVDQRPAHVKVSEGLDRLIRATINHHPAAFFAYREPQVCRPSASTTSATPTPPQHSPPGCRQRSSANGSATVT